MPNHGGAGDEVPLIDISKLGRGDGTAIDTIAGAAEHWGFFQIAGHGIPAGEFDAVWRECRAFFALAASEKRAIERTRDNPWGFYDRELTRNRRDQKEVFDFTVEAAGAGPAGGGGAPFRGANQWPAGHRAFRKTLRSWFRRCEALSIELMRALALGLGLPADAFVQHHGAAHTSFMRLNYYPQRKTPGTDEPPLGIHPHSDAGALTVLLQDDVPGLEVERDGAWFPVRPRPDALVINIGDMVQVWSNDRYRAPLHRVQPSRGRERYSIPFFFNPAYDAVCAPAEPLTRGTSARYRPFTWGEFRRRRADGDFADYGAEVQISDYRVEG